MNLSNEYKYGFLIGVIEGEGCVHIQRIGKNKDNITGNLTIVNTDKNLVNFLDSILKSLDFKYSIRRHNTDAYVEKTGNKEAWRIVITNRHDFKKVLENYFIENSPKKEKLKIVVNGSKRKLYVKRS